MQKQDRKKNNKMKPITSFSFLCSLLILCLTILPYPSHANGTSNLVQQVCANAHNKDACIASLQSNPDSNQATLDQLGIIALRLAAANATDTSIFIKTQTLDGKNLDPSVAQAFEDCEQQYQDAIGQLDSSLAALLSNAYSDVRTWVQAATTAVDTCDQNPGAKPLLSRRNTAFRQLCNNALVINKMLSHQ